jgi:SAM-dependent methyltransferase
MAEDPALGFYEGLAELYHLVYADWEASVERQGRILAEVVRERWRPAHRLLDAACGIGTQALGLAALGFEVVGSDLAPAALARARREAAARGLEIPFVEADLRALGAVHRRAFDVVLACDNAVPHLLTPEEILAAFRQMRALLRPGGGCLISVRDYGVVERTGTHLVPFGVRATPAGRVAVFQVWDFVDERHYDLAMYFVQDLDGAPRARVFRTRYHAILLPELAALLEEAGFEAVERIDGRFFQPLLAGTNPGRA